MIRNATIGIRLSTSTTSALRLVVFRELRAYEVKYSIVRIPDIHNSELRTLGAARTVL